MNSVSWFLYFPDVTNSLSVVFCVVALLSSIGIGVMWLVLTVNASVEDDRFKPAHMPVRMWAFPLILLFLACFLPSKNTMYAIAASQMGEKIAQSEAVRGIADDATRALQNWIRKQIEDSSKSGKK